MNTSHYIGSEYIWSKYIWQVQKGHDRRVRAGHPWVFSNELTKSPKGHPVGHPVELQDDRGNFIACGYGNPNSLISFRALSFEPVTVEPQEFLMSKVLGAWKKRAHLGMKNSFRMCFSENDYLSGLMVDYYVVEQNGQTGQVFAIQISTAGMDFILKNIPDFFKKLTELASNENLTSIPWSHTSIVLKNDIQIRKLEGLEVEDAKVIHQSEHFKLDEIDILITTPLDQSTIKMSTDLIDGQKTGFFLDQTRNIEVVLSQLNKIFKSPYASPKKLRILDLCCYVGHWSVQLAHFCKLHNVEVEITAVDISPKALGSATKNISRMTKNFKTVELDVIDKLDTMTEKYDVVICDPPALIKNKKSIPTGQHAYLKLNTNAMNLLAPQGLYVSCSCSGLFEKPDFLSTLRKSQTRSKKSLQIIAEGGHAADHPHLASFPEGFYLKMLLMS